MRRNDLYHHGIEGQKWGVRNGPPYPLKEKDVSISDKVRVGLKYIKKILLYNNQNIVNNVIAQDNLQKAAEEMKRRGVYTMHISELYK